MRDDFSGSTFYGAYLEKVVAYKANFTGNNKKISFQFSKCLLHERNEYIDSI